MGLRVSIYIRTQGIATSHSPLNFCMYVGTSRVLSSQATAYTGLVLCTYVGINACLFVAIASPFFCGTDGLELER